MPPTLVTLRGLAKFLGVQPSTIHAAVAAGRIRAPNADGKYNRDNAAKQWKENTDQAKQNRKPRSTPGPKSKFASQESEGRGGSFQAARAVRETYAAKLTHLKYQTQAKEVVAVSEVKDQWFKIARTTRDTLLSIPDRLSAIIASIPDGADRDAKINAILRKEIRSILMEMCNAAKRNGLEGPDVEKE